MGSEGWDPDGGGAGDAGWVGDGDGLGKVEGEEGELGLGGGLGLGRLGLVGDWLGLAVGLGAGALGAVGPLNVTTSWGSVEDSRLARPVAVMLVEVSARLTGSFPLTSEVTSH